MINAQDVDVTSPLKPLKFRLSSDVLNRVSETAFDYLARNKLETLISKYTATSTIYR